MSGAGNAVSGNGVLRGKWNKILTGVALVMAFTLAMLGKDVVAFASMASVIVGGGHVATSVGRAHYQPPSTPYGTESDEP